MKKAVYEKRVRLIKEARNPEELDKLIKELQKYGYDHMKYSCMSMMDFYDVDTENVPAKLRGHFLEGYARSVLFYRFYA